MDEVVGAPDDDDDAVAFPPDDWHEASATSETSATTAVRPTGILCMTSTPLPIMYHIPRTGA